MKIMKFLARRSHGQGSLVFGCKQDKRKCLHMDTRNGKDAYARAFLDLPTRVPLRGSLLDGHVLGK